MKKCNCSIGIRTNYAVGVGVPPVVGGTATLEELTITENGEYTPQEGVDGFSKVVADVVPSSRVRVTSFAVNNNCLSAEGIWEGAVLIDTSEVTTFRRLFTGINITAINVSRWNTSKVTNMVETFRNSKLVHLDANNWDTSNVTTLNFFLHTNPNLESINVKDWDVRNVTDFAGFCAACHKLTRLDLSGWRPIAATRFDHFLSTNEDLLWMDITSWEVPNLTNVGNMFYRCGVETLLGGKTIDDVIANNIYTLKDLKVSISLSYTNLDRASLRAVINGLADLTGQTARTLTLGATLIAKLTEEDIAIATNKNWTIV